MKIYLAGGISGNLKPFYHDLAKKNINEQTMTDSLRSFLHENLSCRQYDIPEIRRTDAPWRGGSKTIQEWKPYILESFYYADEDTERLLPYFGDFMLDSGAFTFMENAKIRVDWDEYTERYASFIKRNKVDKFYELDIDSVEGYDEVKRLRAKLEMLTGKQCIPVWHSTRGIEEFKRSCDEYGYVALGGIVGKEWQKNAEKYIPWFISEAHRRGAKIHGLGFTKLKLLQEFHFDSVDSTAWTTGNRFGYIYYFDGKTMQKRDVPKGHRIADPRKAALINYTEWIKFQRYADKHL